MTTVYASKEGMYVWNDNNGTHKAGKVPLHTPLDVLKTTTKWYKIERPEDLSLPFDPSYPSYWVKRGDTVDSPYGGGPIIPEPIFEISDTDVTMAIVTILKWLRQ